MIIVLSGKARSGKDTVAKILSKELRKKGVKHESIAYADSLKDILFTCFRLTHDHLYGDLKEVELKYLPKHDKYGVWTTRKLMQYIGTDVFRDIYDNVWVEIVKNEVLSSGNNYIITDARFDNEVDWVLGNGGYHIHITRYIRDSISNDTHVSENTLIDFDDHVRRFFISNNSDIKNLTKKVRLLLKTILNKESKNGKCEKI